MSDAARRWWGIAAFLAVAACVLASLPLYDGLKGLPLLADPPSSIDLREHLFTTFEASMAVLIVWYRPRNPVGWLLMLAAGCEALSAFGQVYGQRALGMPGSDLPAGRWVTALSAPLWVPSLLIPATLILLRYPNGELHGRWARRCYRGIAIGLVLLCVGYAAGDNAVSDEIKGGHSPLPVPDVLAAPVALVAAFLIVGGLVFTVVHTVRRTLRAQAPERQQLVLLVLAVPAVLIGTFAPYDIAQPLFFWVPLAFAIGVLRYRLLGFEVIVRRTLLYGALTGLVLAVFVAVTSALDALVGKGIGPDVAAAVVVAGVLAPGRDRLQRVVDRFVYGDRRDPWRAFDRLGREAASSDALTDVVAAVAQSLRLPGAELHATDGLVAAWGSEGAEAPIPLVVAGEPVGELRVCLRRGERSLAVADERLLHALAPMLGLVLRSTLLAQDLEVERERVVTARESERARLRRDLHDGLGPSLTGIGLGLEAAQTSDPQRSQAILARLREETTASLEEVRRILDDLRPGALESAGLLDLLLAKAAHLTATTGVTVTVVAPDQLPAVAADVETAALRIVDEALTNVIRHAGATTCTVTVTHDGELHVQVTDDGVGYAGPRSGGVGVPSMRSRAEALGGSVELSAPGRGTVLTARLPA